eukprot:6576555-Pyramimonas_sp.AAC.1
MYLVGRLFGIPATKFPNGSVKVGMLRLATLGASSSSSSAASGEHVEMFPGQRMAERTARAVMLDNA